MSHLGPSSDDATHDIIETGQALSGHTEWEDALIKHKIIQAKIAGPSQEEIHTNTAQQQVLDQQSLDDQSIDDIDALLDRQTDQGGDQAEERMMAAYRAQRIQALKVEQSKARFGVVQEIRADQFKNEVTEASRQCVVIALLYTPGLPACEAVLTSFPLVARAHPQVKFVRIVGADAIANYPERLTPTLLIYQKGDLTTQLVGTDQCGGDRAEPKQLERALLAARALSGSVLQAQAVHMRRRKDSDEDNDDDDEDD